MLCILFFHLISKLQQIGIILFFVDNRRVHSRFSNTISWSVMLNITTHFEIQEKTYFILLLIQTLKEKIFKEIQCFFPILNLSIS